MVSNLSERIHTDMTNQRVWLSKKAVKEFIKEQSEELKVLFCMNPDVQFCGECWACRGIDDINLKKAGEDLI